MSMKRKVERFTTGDARCTAKKIEVLYAKLNLFLADMERIRIEVEVLRDANIAMSKTIKKNRYQEK
tara:strand:- start:476 stop:673 length:198 start_codon:yes stop_codon:yes gene_type:complete